MIPQRFIVEYPKRCLQLIDIVEPSARKENLLGSFSLMIAPSLFVIPYERMRREHPLKEASIEPEIYDGLRQILKQKFLRAEFWENSAPKDWRFSRIISDVNDSRSWIDEHGSHPMSEASENTIDKRSVDEVCRVLRNALAHGNVIYLDEKGVECAGVPVRFLAFLSRYQESKEEPANSETYRLVATTEQGFLEFLKRWSSCLSNFVADSEIREAA